MAELLSGRVPPFEVAVGYHPIMDYRFVNAGQPRWVGADGKPIHYWETADPDEIRASGARVSLAHVNSRSTAMTTPTAAAAAASTKPASHLVCRCRAASRSAFVA